ncbi:hypothetical protein [uncultured Mediterranean phage uvMED]|nr:hypothetical protein [uncultured Mediterranean phage uvMED]BAR22530.1 hypothetical protein [uncultured Mediterranean phage uvMED]
MTKEHESSIQIQVPDGRTYASGKKPKQVVIQQAAKRSRCHRKRMKAEKDMKEAQGKLRKVEKELDVKQQFLEMMNSAPTPAQQRKALLALFYEKGINPIEELLGFAADPSVDKRDKIAIWKEICSYTQPKLKSVDVQGTLNGEMKVMTVDYSKVSKSTLANPVEAEIVGEDYDEFMSEEDKHE